MKIAFIGTGVMGKSMAMHLCNAKHEVKVYNRSIQKALQCESFGAKVCESIEECVNDVEVVITIVGYPKDVKEVYSQIFKYAKEGCISIDMTTSSPSLAKELSAEGIKHQIHVLDAPVSGGDFGAKNATLSIMVGGEKTAFDQVQPLLKCMGKNIVYMGSSGSGQHTKMANQIAIAGTTVAVAEALYYGKKAGLNLDEMLNAISAGAAGSWQMSNMAPRMLNSDYEPGFFVKHFIKDMDLAQNEALGFDIELPVLNVVLSLYQELAKGGFDNDGTQVIYKYFDEK